jgi:hypothetical protein
LRRFVGLVVVLFEVEGDGEIIYNKSVEPFQIMISFLVRASCMAHIVKGVQSKTST